MIKPKVIARLKVSGFIKEPFIHFMLFGLVIFILAAFLTPSDANSQLIRISEGEIERLKLSFQKSRQRLPSNKELQGLIDDTVREEVFYREAQNIGLDNQDTIIRRRLRQKYEFLIEDSLNAEHPSDTVLQQYLDSHLERFKSEARLAFRQIYFKSHFDISGEQEASATLAKIQRRSLDDNEVKDLGQSSFVPSSYSLTRLSRIDSDFSQGFTKQFFSIELNVWKGPYRSALGWHLIKLEQRELASQPKLTEVYDSVLREWQAEQRVQRLDQRYQELLSQYQLIIADRLAGEH